MPQCSQGSRRVGAYTPVSLYRANPGVRLRSLALAMTPALLPSVPPHDRVSSPAILIASPAGRGANLTQEKSHPATLPFTLPALPISEGFCPHHRGLDGTHAGVVADGGWHSPWPGSTEGCVAADSGGPGSGKALPAAPAREPLPSRSPPPRVMGGKGEPPIPTPAHTCPSSAAWAPRAQGCLPGGNKEVSACYHVPPGTFWPRALTAQLSAFGVPPGTTGCQSGGIRQA